VRIGCGAVGGDHRGRRGGLVGVRILLKNLYRRKSETESKVLTIIGVYQIVLLHMW
jgi:hypothetical protein